MAAAFVTIRLKGASGRIYCPNAYCSDAANVLGKFDETKVPVAGSPDHYILKETCDVFDICFETDLATPTHVQLMVDGSPVESPIPTTALLCTVTARPTPYLRIPAKSKLQIMQLA